jgi:hypothetical protein
MKAAKGGVSFKPYTTNQNHFLLNNSSGKKSRKRFFIAGITAIGIIAVGVVLCLYFNVIPNQWFQKQQQQEDNLNMNPNPSPTVGNNFEDFAVGYKSVSKSDISESGELKVNVGDKLLLWDLNLSIREIAVDNGELWIAARRGNLSSPFKLERLVVENNGKIKFFTNSSERFDHVNISVSGEFKITNQSEIRLFVPKG